MKFKIENIKKDIEFIENRRNQWFPSGWSLKAKKIIKFLLDENENVLVEIVKNVKLQERERIISIFSKKLKDFDKYGSKWKQFENEVTKAIREQG